MSDGVAEPPAVAYPLAPTAGGRARRVDRADRSPTIPADDFEAMYPGLLRLARVVAPPGTDPADLLHEAVARCLARFRRRGAVDDAETYIARSVINLSRSRRRQHLARSAATPSEWPPAAADPPGEPDEVAALLDQLHPRQRACLWLRFGEDLSVERTAALLGCSEGTVKSQTSKALRRLRLGDAATPTSNTTSVPTPAPRPGPDEEGLP